MPCQFFLMGSSFVTGYDNYTFGERIYHSNQTGIMKKYLHILLVPALCTQLAAQVKVDDYYRKSDGKDQSRAIQRAFDHLDSLGHGSVEFTGTRTYYVEEDIELPRYTKYGSRTIVLNGNGCLIKAANNVNVFNRIPKNQGEALNKMMSTRFVINDFVFRGGSKAINLGATYGSCINRCTFITQRVAAVDIQFGLMTQINECIATNCFKDSFVLRHGGAWGGNGANSQSNHSVISSCRVYAKAGANTAFKILASSGCVLRDIISEGSSDIQYSIYADRLTSTTVRLFKIENFHLEHAPVKAGIYVNITGIADIDGVFYQLSHEEFPLVLSGPSADHINLSNIPHWVRGTVIEQQRTGRGTAWVMDHCNKNFYKNENWRCRGEGGIIENKKPYWFTGQGYKDQAKKKFGDVAD